MGEGMHDGAETGAWAERCIRMAPPDTAPRDIGEAARLVGEDLAFQRRVWRVQRGGWVVMFAVVIAALAGAFGLGPLAEGEARSADGALSARWDRIARVGRDVRMVLRSEGGGELTLRGDLVQGLGLVSAEPTGAPRARGPGTLVLAAEAPRGEPAEVALRLRADGPGLLSATLGDGTRTLPLRVLVLP